MNYIHCSKYLTFTYNGHFNSHHPHAGPCYAHNNIQHAAEM